MSSNTQPTTISTHTHSPTQSQTQSRTILAQSPTTLTPTQTMSTHTRTHKRCTSLKHDVWKERLALIEPFLDVESMLSLRQTNRFFYKHKYKIGCGHLIFNQFLGYDPKIVCDKILPLACRSMHPTFREELGLTLDFSNCTLLKDASLARLVGYIYGDVKTNALQAKVKAIILDFCYQISDHGLCVMLSTHLPYLEKLSIKCVRNLDLTGSVCTTFYSESLWPRWTHFNCSFSNISLECLAWVAHILKKNAHEHQLTPFIEMFGTSASKCLLDRYNPLILKSFDQAVQSQNDESARLITKQFQKELLEGELTKESDNHLKHLFDLVKNFGSELLVNAPLLVESSQDCGDGLRMLTLPITVALQKKDFKMFSLLLKRGAKLNIWDFLGRTPLSRACEINCLKMVELLIELGASPRTFDIDGQSCLEMCIKKKDVHLVEILIKRGCLINQTYPNCTKFKSPLYVACEVNCPPIIHLLLEYGANPNWQSSIKMTPTLLAYQLDSKWLVPFLDAGAGLSEKHRCLLTEVLSCAISKSDLNSIKLLIDRFPDLIHRSNMLWSLPHIQASRIGKKDVLLFLIEHGSNLDAVGEDGSTALHVATDENSIECVQLLLRKNVCIDKPRKNGQTALHICALENRYEITEILLDGGINPNNLDRNQETSLMCSIKTRNIAIAHLILEKAKGLDCHILNEQGHSALTYAMFFGQYEIAKPLMERGVALDYFTYNIVCERKSISGGDKRILNKYLRLAKAQYTHIAHPTKSTQTYPSNMTHNELVNTDKLINRAPIPKSTPSTYTQDGKTITNSSSSDFTHTPNSTPTHTTPNSSQSTFYTLNEERKARYEKRSMISIVRRPIALLKAASAK